MYCFLLWMDSFFIMIPPPSECCCGGQSFQTDGRSISILSFSLNTSVTVNVTAFDGTTISSVEGWVSSSSGGGQMSLILLSVITGEFLWPVPLTNNYCNSFSYNVLLHKICVVWKSSKLQLCPCCVFVSILRTHNSEVLTHHPAQFPVIILPRAEVITTAPHLCAEENQWGVSQRGNEPIIRVLFSGIILEAASSKYNY